jgi:hypothetical protein
LAVRVIEILVEQRRAEPVKKGVSRRQVVGELTAA